jgi:hypothetical protein
MQSCIEKPQHNFEQSIHRFSFTEMEVTEIILTKVSRLCQLSSHSRRFLARLQIFKSIGPRLWIYFFWGGGHGEHAHKTPSYDTKMLLKVVFDKTLFVKFKISNNFKQNVNKTHLKQPKIQRKIHTSLGIFKISRKKSANQKSRDFCQMFVTSKKIPYPRVWI